MIEELYKRFDEIIFNYLTELNELGKPFSEKEFNEVVENFSYSEECTINVVFASKFSTFNELTHVVVINLYDELNHKIISRVSSLRFSTI